MPRHRAWRDTLWSRGLPPLYRALCSTVAWALIAAYWRPQQSDWHRKAFAADQTSPDACAHNTLEYAAENAAVAEPFIAGSRKRRVIRDLVLNREPTKPEIGKVHAHISTYRPMRSDRKHVPDDEHPDHQHRIDRRPAEPRIIRC